MTEYVDLVNSILSAISNKSKTDGLQEEIAKFKSLEKLGLIDKDQYKLIQYVLGISLDFDIVELEQQSFTTPLIIVAKPTAFSKVQRELPDALPADPYTGKFPTISLLSLEKTINAIANGKIPWVRFTVYIHSSYRDIPAKARYVLNKLAEIYDEANRVMILKFFYLIPKWDSGDDTDVSKILCHARKKLGLAERDECDDNEWWKYNFWGRRLDIEISPQEINKIAIRHNVPVVFVKSVVNAVSRNAKIDVYAKSFGVPLEVAQKVADEVRAVLQGRSHV